MLLLDFWFRLVNSAGIPAPELLLCIWNIIFLPFFCILLISLYTFLSTSGERYRAWNLPTIQSTIL